jgi:hypothetical protein
MRLLASPLQTTNSRCYRSKRIQVAHDERNRHQRKELLVVSDRVPAAVRDIEFWLRLWQVCLNPAICMLKCLQIGGASEGWQLAGDAADLGRFLFPLARNCHVKVIGELPRSFGC